MSKGGLENQELAYQRRALKSTWFSIYVQGLHNNSITSLHTCHWFLPYSIASMEKRAGLRKQGWVSSSYGTGAGYDTVSPVLVETRMSQEYGSYLLLKHDDMSPIL